MDSIFSREKQKRNNQAHVDGICVPKMDTLDDYRLVHEQLTWVETDAGLAPGSLKVIPQVESTLSFVYFREIFELDQKMNGVESKRIVAAAFGGDDFTADFGVSRSDDDFELDFARKLFALTCHAFNVVSIDTPYVQYKDTEGLRTELSYLKKIGMKAKFAIHPTQIEVINQSFCPSQEEVDYYSDMVSQFEAAQEQEGKAAINFRGKMVDIAAYRRAKSTLEKSARLSHLK
mmetsp:Transcript_3455/g.5870  ORF Transcript_3455/g.5870 Transcript_3455/m.5870 type:complete len:232 (-) Transcript_3455:32-727(-)